MKQIYKQFCKLEKSSSIYSEPFYHNEYNQNNMCTSSSIHKYFNRALHNQQWYIVMFKNQQKMYNLDNPGCLHLVENCKCDDLIIPKCNNCNADQCNCYNKQLF
jgi:hypothetical protein